MNNTLFRMLFSVCVILLLVSGCGASKSDTPSPVYKVDYVPGTGMNAPVQGKTVFQLRITKTGNGAAATGLTPTLSMTMHMANGDNHSTPMDPVTESSTPGLYDCTVYYLMASGPSMGTWEMRVTVNGETTTFNPDVAMVMGTDTVRATLYGMDDVMTGMSGTSYNKYYLFRDGMLSASMPVLRLYISRGENMMMRFVPASAGSMMTGPTGSVTSMIVEASSDNGSTWNAGTDNGNGHWEVSGLFGLASGVTSTIRVRMSVNGQTKTTNGTTDYASFIATPGM